MNHSHTDTDFMRAALKVADKALAAGEIPVGAVVVLDNTIIGTGHNRSAADCDPSAHAEVVALREAALKTGQFRLDDATLYVTIEPCLMCCGALLQARIGRLVFGAREPRTGAVLSHYDTLMSPSTKQHVAITEGVLAEEGASRMRRYFAARR